ncbi:MAG: CYTH domain-containing protein [Eubacterium sp.]|nr:CYTH domain-containing protein [Eubacterium sp.]
MKGVEIEFKYLPKELPSNLDSYEHHKIEQAYLGTAPVVRIRQEDDQYILTYKNGAGFAHNEVSLPLDEKSYKHLLEKADGNIITKTRYFIPLEDGHTAELDIFEDKFDGMLLVEVEFESLDDADSFVPPDWFGENVTKDKRYHNSYLSRVK